MYNFTGGSDPFLGIGGPEIVVILMMGYFLLGPKELYHLIKQVGKFIGHFRGMSTNLTTSLEKIVKHQTDMIELSMSDESLDVKWGNIKEDESCSSNTGTSLEAILLKEGLSRGDVEIFNYAEEDERRVMHGDGEMEEEDSDKYEYIWEDEEKCLQSQLLVAVQEDWKDLWISARTHMSNIVNTNTSRGTTSYIDDEKTLENLPQRQVIKGTDIIIPEVPVNARQPPHMMVKETSIGQQRNEIPLLQDTDAAATTTTTTTTTVMTESWKHLDESRLLTLKPTTLNPYSDRCKIDKMKKYRLNKHGDNNIRSSNGKFNHLESAAVEKLEEDRNDFMHYFETELDLKVQQLKIDMVKLIEKEYRMKKQDILPDKQN